MNELEEKLNKMIDAVSEFAKVYLRERLNISKEENSTTENKEKVVVEVSAKPENLEQHFNIPENLIEKRKMKYRSTWRRLSKEKILPIIENIYKENPNITKLKLIQELARKIEFPMSYRSYDRYITPRFFTNGSTTHKRFNNETFDDIICLNRIGFNKYYIAVALGVSPAAIEVVCKKRVSNEYTLDRIKEAFLKNPGYLYNVARLCDIDVDYLVEDSLKFKKPVLFRLKKIQKTSTKNPEIIKEVQTVKELFKLGKTLEDIINETGLQEYFVQGVLNGTLYSDITINQSA